MTSHTIFFYTFNGNELCQAKCAAHNGVYTVNTFFLDNGFIYINDMDHTVHGLCDWRVTRLAASEFYMVTHPNGNIMIRVINDEAQLASPTEINAYNAGVAVAAGRLSYLKVMKELILTIGIKGLISFLVEKVNRASINGWEPEAPIDFDEE